MSSGETIALGSGVVLGLVGKQRIVTSKRPLRLALDDYHGEIDASPPDTPRDGS